MEIVTTILWKPDNLVLITKESWNILGEIIIRSIKVGFFVLLKHVIKAAQKLFIAPKIYLKKSAELCCIRISLNSLLLLTYTIRSPSVRIRIKNNGVVYSFMLNCLDGKESSYLVSEIRKTLMFPLIPLNNWSILSWRIDISLHYNMCNISKNPMTFITVLLIFPYLHWAEYLKQTYLSNSWSLSQFARICYYLNDRISYL